MERRNTPVVRPVHFCLINPSSVNNNTLLIKDFVAEHCIDLLAVTETWLQSEMDNDFFLLFVICVLLAIHYSMFHDLAPPVVVESIYCFDHALIPSCNHAGNLFRLSTSNYY